MSQKHQRTINYTTERISKERLSLVAELLDQRAPYDDMKHTIVLHHMRVEIELDLSLKIHSAKFKTLAAPFTACGDHQVSAERLVGLNMGRGFTKKVSELYGGISGCSHILTLLMGMASAIRQGWVFTHMFPDQEKGMTPESLKTSLEQMRQHVVNSCQMWVDGSEPNKSIDAGLDAGLTARLFPSYFKKAKGPSTGP